MRSNFALIGDIHMQADNLEAVMALLQQRRITSIFCSGDIVDRGSEDVELSRDALDRCTRLLKLHDVVAVRGNHDRWILEDTMRSLPGATPVAALSPESRRFLEVLPPTRMLEVDGRVTMLCHGLGEDDMLRFHPGDPGYGVRSDPDLAMLVGRSDLDLIMAGHTHRQGVHMIGKVAYLNAGTLVSSDEGGLLVGDAGAIEQWLVADGELHAAGSVDIPWRA